MHEDLRRQWVSKEPATVLLTKPKHLQHIAQKNKPIFGRPQAQYRVCSKSFSLVATCSHSLIPMPRLSQAHWDNAHCNGASNGLIKLKAIWKTTTSEIRNAHCFAMPGQYLCVVDECLQKEPLFQIRLAKSAESVFEGSLNAKLLTVWTDGKAQPGRSSGMEKVRREKIRDGESQKREGAGARKGREIAKHCVFPMFCRSGGSKSRLAKAGAEPAGQMRDEQLYAVVARSTFGSQKWQSAPCSEHFWKWRCRSSARRCGAKHVWK